MAKKSSGGININAENVKIETNGGDIVGNDKTVANTNASQRESEHDRDEANWTKQDADLRDVLCGLYFGSGEIARIADEAGMNRGRRNFNGYLVTIWHSFVKEAKLQGKRDALIAAALREFPDNESLQLAAAGKSTAVRGQDIEKDINWRPSASAETLEKIIGKQNTILPISFFELGMKKSRSVVRILLKDGECGSGFLVHNNLIVTNHHVIPSAEQAATATAQFNVQRNADGLDLPSEEFSFAPGGGFRTSAEDDWTILRLDGDANTKWGAIPLGNNSVAKNDRVIIVQHPGGGPKSVALYHNIVTYADDSRVQYLTDTQPGSSGSPVFDSDWALVAVHHSGGWLREPGSKQPLFRNEGISIQRITSSATDLLKS